jgi:arylsulfatase A-like enzyme
MGRLRRLAAVVVAAVLLGCSPAGGEGDPEASRGDGREWRDANVVLIGLDTLRADHVGAYGYPRPTTPRIDQLAAESVTFDVAVSQAPWTLPAFASIFTGVLPSFHRAGEGQAPAVSRLDETRPTLATLLRAAGYRTASFVSNSWVGTKVGMARGFQTHGEWQFSKDAVDAAVGWLEQQGSERFFLFVHILEPHHPYIPDAADAEVFIDPAYTGKIGMAFLGAPPPDLMPADHQRIVDLYDGEIRWGDRQAGRVLDALAARGLAERTIVILTADHGEELFDRGELGHGHSLHRELLQVPLVMRFPGGPKTHVSRPVRSMDIFATIFDAVGLPVPSGVNAVSLMPLVRGTAPPPGSDVALAEYVCFGNRELKAIRTPTEKLILNPASREVQLYDLATDPEERHDVAAIRPAVATALQGRLENELVASADGFHLVARRGQKDVLFRARLVAESGFRDVAPAGQEPHDGYRLSPDRKVLDVKFHLEATEFPRGSDLDGISFRTTDDRRVRLVRLEIDGAMPPWGQVSLGAGALPAQGQPLPWPLTPGAPALTVRYPEAPPAALDGNPRVRFDFVRRGEAPKAKIDPETIERLRALGYVP